MWRRIAPALLLVVIAPFVGEFLLGNTPISALYALPIDAAMYGAGAVFIREITRRTGRGWPTMLALGLAYGIAEEGLGDMSLFDPNFMGLHLLGDGRLFGIGWTWWCYVLTLHVLWSIGTSIGLTEALFARRGNGPWLGKVGLTVAGVIFVLGTAVVHVGFSDKYHLSVGQALLSVALVVVISVIAFLLPRPGRRVAGTRPVPPAWRVTALVVVAALAFHVATRVLPGGWPVLADLVLYLGVAVPVVAWSRRAGWDTTHRFAPVAGGVLAYVVVGFWLVPRDAVDIAGQVLFALIGIGLVILAARRTVAVANAPSPVGDPAGTTDVAATPTH